MDQFIDRREGRHLFGLNPEHYGDPVDLRMIHHAFEDAELSPHAFDLVVAATSFHWLDPDTALDKIADVLRPGGHVALWWNVFSDLGQLLAQLMEVAQTRFGGRVERNMTSPVYLTRRKDS